MWYDGLMMMALFALRILVPVLLTVAVGYWLEKRLGLEEPEIIELVEPAERVEAGATPEVQPVVVR